jgi:hypothetical protein
MEDGHGGEEDSVLKHRCVVGFRGAARLPSCGRLVAWLTWGLFRYQILDLKFGPETLYNTVVILFLFCNNCPNID